MALEGNLSTSDLLKRTDENGVTILTLNAPISINALSEAMLAALSPVSILKRVERLPPELPAEIHGVNKTALGRGVQGDSSRARQITEIESVEGK